MHRRTFIAGAGASLGATLTGCLGATGEATCAERLRAETDNVDDRFLPEGEKPEAEGAVAFLRVVAEATGGRTGFDGGDGAPRLRFAETGSIWTVEYYADVVGQSEPFYEEIGAIARAFTTHRPDGVALNARALHECQTGVWHVCPDPAASYGEGELGREAFQERVRETVAIQNNC